MASSPYAIALGRLKAEFPSFFGRDAYASLLASHDLGDVVKFLEGSVYGPEVAAVRATHTGPAMVELAVNRRLVRRNRLAFESTPFAGRPGLAAYLRRWDLLNLEAIFVAKAEGRALREAEEHLVSGRDLPAGLAGGLLTIDDLRQLLELPSLDALAQALVRFGYGGTILPRLEEFARSRDIFALRLALRQEYYRAALEAARFFQGDEWVVRSYLQGEIDATNLLTLAKAKETGVPPERTLHRWIDGGTILRGAAEELLSAPDVPALFERFSGRYPSLPAASDAYRRTGSLVPCETALERDRLRAEFRRLRAYPLSLALPFAYLLVAEAEWRDLRRIAYGVVYGLSAEEIRADLLSPLAEPGG